MVLRGASACGVGWIASNRSRTPRVRREHRSLDEAPGDAGRASPSAPTRLPSGIVDRERTVAGDWEQDCLCASL